MGACLTLLSHLLLLPFISPHSFHAPASVLHSRIILNFLFSPSNLPIVALSLDVTLVQEPSHYCLESSRVRQAFLPYDPIQPVLILPLNQSHCGRIAYLLLHILHQSVSCAKSMDCICLSTIAFLAETQGLAQSRHAKHLCQMNWLIYIFILLIYNKDAHSRR